MKSAGQLGSKPTFTTGMLSSYAKQLSAGGLTKEGVVKALAELSEKELEALYGKFNSYGTPSKLTVGKATLKLQPAAQQKVAQIKEATTPKPAAEQAKKSASATFELQKNGLPKVPTQDDLAKQHAMAVAKVKSVAKAVQEALPAGSNKWQALLVLKYVSKAKWLAGLDAAALQAAIAEVPGLAAHIQKASVWK